MQHPRDPLRHEMVTWAEIDEIVDVLIPQINTIRGFDGIVLITRGGMIPGGLLAEALNIAYVLTAAVQFPDQSYSEFIVKKTAQLGLPSFLQFPETKLVEGRKLLIVDDVWGSGRTSASIKGRLEASKATCYTCVFHYNPYRSLFQESKPDFYGAITDAYIIYPWEVDRGVKGIPAGDPTV
jgi:uncharacterized protein